MKTSYLITKGVFDILFATILLTLLSPVLIIITIIIKLDSKGPVFYTQNRLGKNLKEFRMYKFRTMTDKNHELSYDEEIKGKMEGVTLVGYWLRKFKIDELPQLINVIMGQMSFVGPRPLLAHHTEHMNKKALNRFKVKPGLTGLAQINGNIYLSREERYKYDLAYIEKLSFLMDIKIIIKTIMVVLLGEEKFAKNKKNA